MKSLVDSFTKEEFDKNRHFIDKFYRYFENAISKEYYEENIIEMGYLLTDIYERNGEYKKSVKIAKSILHIYKSIPSVSDTVFRKKYVRQMIGCTYSVAIAKLPHKDELMNDAECLFEMVTPIFNDFVNDVTNPDEDRYFIAGLYHSNYGAFLLNKGMYNDAQKEYEKSLSERLNCLLSIDESDTDKREEVENMIGRSKLNIGYACYYLGDYKKSVEKQKEALIIFEEQNDKSRIHQTKDCILGGYIELWKSNIDKFNAEDFIMCCLYITDLLNYYSANEDIKAKIKLKKDEVESIIDLLPVIKDKEQAREIFKNILGGI